MRLVLFPPFSLLPRMCSLHILCLTQLHLGSDLTHRVSTSCTSALKKGHSLCLDQALQRQKGMKATMRSTMEPSTTPTIKYGKSLERATMAPVPRPLCPPLSGGCCWGATVEGGRRPGRPRDFRAVKERDGVRHRQGRSKSSTLQGCLHFCGVNRLQQWL